MPTGPSPPGGIGGGGGGDIEADVPGLKPVGLGGGRGGPGGAGTGGGTGGPPGLPSAPRTEVGPLNGLRSPCGCGMTVEVKLGPGSLPLFCKLDSGKSCSCDEVS